MKYEIIKIITSICIVLLSVENVYSDEKGVVIGDNVRLRSKPNGEIITKLNINNKVIILDKTKEVEAINGLFAQWYKVKTDKNEEGWIFGAYVSETNLNNTFENLYIGQYRNSSVFIDVPFKKELMKDTDTYKNYQLEQKLLDEILIDYKSFKYINIKVKADSPRNFLSGNKESNINGPLTSYLDMINTSVNYDLLKGKIDLKLNDKLIVKSKDKSIEAVIESFVVSRNEPTGSYNLNAILKAEKIPFDDMDIIIAGKKISLYPKNKNSNVLKISDDDKRKIEKYIVERGYVIKNSLYIKGNFLNNFFYYLILRNQPEGAEDYESEVMIGDMNLNFVKIYDLNIVPVTVCDFDEDNVSDIIIEDIGYEGYCNGIIHYNKNTKKWDIIRTNYFGM